MNLRLHLSDNFVTLDPKVARQRADIPNKMRPGCLGSMEICHEDR